MKKKQFLQELRNLDENSLRQKIAEEEKKLLLTRLRTRASRAAEIKNPLLLRILRKNLACMHTILGEKALGKR